MSWNSLGTIIPSHNIWSPFTSTQGSGELFRFTFAAPRAMDKIFSFGWLSFKYIGGAESMPPTFAFKVFPDFRGRLVEIPFSQNLLELGYTHRIFEVKKNRIDPIEWSFQIEEFI